MTPIAIVGMGCLFPGAADLEQFWKNVRDGVDAISKVPATRWDPIYYDPASSAADRFYCDRGGFVDEHANFDPLSFGVLPKVLGSTDPEQLLTLKVGVEALRDAGYDNLAKVPRDRTGVIIGKGAYPNAAGQKLQQQVSVLPQLMVALRDLLPDVDPQRLEAVQRQVQDQLPDFGADAAAGIIPNLVASRLANRLDLHGPAYVVDAACASFMIALQQAVSALRHDEADLMLVGAVHLCHDPALWATFCQLGALSRVGVIKPFSSSADGTLAGEGVGVVVVKRLADAQADGDRIYAVIEGVGSSSDGRAMGLLAPSSPGQQMAVERAWKDVGIDRSMVGLLEAHGTGTLAGDAAELETIAACFGPQVGERAVMGSVKSMIGHAMPAAGAAATIKAALAIHHGWLPPSLHCPDPHPLLEETRFRICDKAEAWLQAPSERIAAVNAFGFGGINGHAVLRGHGEAPQQGLASPAATAPDVLTLHAPTIEALLARLDAGERDARPGDGAVRLAIVEPNERKLAAARKIVAAGKPHRGRQQIFFSPSGLISDGGKLAVLFPGVDGAFHPRGETLSAYFKIGLPTLGEAEQPMAFSLETLHGVLAFNAFTFEALKRLSVIPDAIAGHSLGEFNAMVTSGLVQGVKDMAELVYTPSDQWPAHIGFLAAGCDGAVLQGAIEDLQGVYLTHENCPNQSVACGDAAGLETLGQRLQQLRVLSQVLPFVGGFHSAHLATELAHLDTTSHRLFAKPHTPVWSAATAAPYPSDEDEAKAVAAAFQIQPVRFRQLIENLYETGHRVFVQAGAGGLSGLVADTLGQRPHLAIAANHPTRDGLAQLTQMSAALWVEGAAHDTQLLEPGRAVTPSQEAPTRALPLQLGAPMFRLSALDLPAAGHAASATPRSVLDSNDPVALALHETLDEIEQARRTVVDLMAQRTSAWPMASTADHPP
ncbi:MAG: beta-ketoacyl synthase N-terminal-like domain-containing protein, partial [Caulobacter sp.]